MRSSGRVAVQSQAEPRFKKRMPCRVRVGDSQYGGLVLNVSRGGVFVQTSARAEPGAEVWLELQPEATRGVIEMGAQVVWQRVVDARFRSVATGGVGLKIRSAPEPFYTLLLQLSGAALPPAPEAPSPAPGPRYRVRVKQRTGSRTRSLSLNARCADAARRRALEQLGAGWVVLEVEPL
jgi:Tfp pilus assembly protein PilZ